jgi:LysR family hydrogen peroxide-inducible transcriptional activator
MKYPNLKHLHYLVVLFEEQHFHRAAARCFIGQSTLSTAIQNLEEQCGQQILERDNKQFVFTSFGIELVSRARDLLQHADDFSDYASTGGDWQTSTVLLGSIPTIAPFIFSDILSNTKQAYPKLTIKLTEDTSENLVQKLSAGELDVILLALPFATPGCKQKIIGKDPFHLVGTAEALAKLPDPINYSHLPRESVYLLHAEHCMTDHAVSACQLAFKEQVNSLAASSIFTLLQMAQSQEGYTFIPELARRHGILAQTVLQVRSGDKDAYREIALVWRATSRRYALFNAIAEVLAPLIPEPV